jgi:hypothetical protein
VVEAQRLLRASREHVFAYVARPEYLPRYGAPMWLTADAETRRGGAGEPLLTLRGYFAGLPVEAVVRTSARSPQSLEVTQVRGTLRAFSQRFTIEAGDEGTRLTCRVEVDPGIPMLSDEAAKHFLVQYVERMLDRLRLAAERRAPTRRLVRPGKPGAAGDADDTTQIDLPAAGTAVDVGQTGQDEARAAEAAAGTPQAEPAQSSPAPSSPRRRFRLKPPMRSRPRPAPAESDQSRTGANGSAAGASAAGGGRAPAGQPGAAPGDGGPSRRRRRRRRRRGRGGGDASGSGEQGGGQTPTT